jgi:hypothetical protein
MRRFPALLAALASLVLASAPAAAQQSDDRVSVVGRVVDSAEGRPVHGARVEIPRLGISTTTDPAGEFRLPRIRAGTHRFQVERIGYVANRQEITLAPGDSLVVIPLLARPMLLEGLTVSADRLARRRERFGMLAQTVSREQIQVSSALNVVDLVTTRTGLRVRGCEMDDSVCEYVIRDLEVPAISIYVDDQPVPGGIRMLQAYSSKDLYLVEFFPNGKMLRLYTVWYVEDLARNRRQLPPIMLF